MKRSKPLRRTELRSKPSPDKVRETLRARDQRASAGSSGPEKGTLEWALDAPFKARRPARTQTCIHCSARAQHWHHWLPQKTLRQYARHWAFLNSSEPEEIRHFLRDLLRDERNLSPACAHFNMALEAWSGERPVPPKSAYDFARELGDEWVARLERSYPS